MSKHRCSLTQLNSRRRSPVFTDVESIEVRHVRAVSAAIDRRNEDADARPCLMTATTSRAMPNRSDGTGPLPAMPSHDEQASG
jgi:hypothetical protein